MLTTTRRATKPAGALGRWLTGAALFGVTAGLALLLARVTGSLPHVLPGYDEWQEQAYRRIPQFLRWVLGDTTEAQFYKSALGGLGLLAGGWIAHVAWKRRRRWAGFPVSGNTGLWPWVTAAALLGLLLSNIAWGWTLPASGSWQPTFVAFVSVPPMVVLTYGAGWRVAVTGAVLGAALTTPVALLLVNFVCVPLGLPAVVGSVTAMWVSALVAFPLCRRLPWLPEPVPPPASAGTTPRQGPVWVVRRVLADFSEAPFHGNEIASLGLLAGTVLTYLLNPLTPVYGSGLLPALLTAQVLAATVGVLVYRRQWARHGWYPTFVPVVSVAPAVVLTYGPTWPAVLSGAVLGALAAPPLAAFASRRMPLGVHPCAGNTFAMTVCTATLVPLLDIVL
ncbi:hypothetical protein GCM10017786_60030 [Amycolatopsis deserti]|uniref:Integral membrane protein n=1 Tax=Amycolatopsis deserti TaxID=185696 RepID=A0ABQ3JFD4_9PSEU|nr:hypothetical protein [Amycolatopsis deserti]GHF18279.1 hypothetical protein GCM10017786_60030 [Amycolatopsis deserti]